MPSAFAMGPLGSSNSGSRSLELLRLLNHPRPLTTRRWEVWKTRANDNNIICLYGRYLLSSRLPWSHRSNASNPKVRFLVNILLFYIGLALSSYCSCWLISDITILSLAIRQSCHAHLLLFECYLLIISISICQAIPNPQQRSILIFWLFLILFLGSPLSDRRSCSVV
jgi:hypothetical protein